MRSEWFELGPRSDGPASRVVRPVGHDVDVSHRLSEVNPVTDLPILRWTWQHTDALDDLPFTVDSVRLVSARVRAILEEHLGPADELQWIQGTVEDATGTEHPFWVPHFPVHHDLLDLEHTTWGPSGLPIRYVYSASKLVGHAVTVYSVPARTVHVGERLIHLPSTTPSGLYLISAEVAEALRSANVTGARITPAPVTYEPDPRS